MVILRREEWDLTTALSAEVLPSFHNDHLLVAHDELDRTVRAIRQLLDTERIG